MTPEQRQAISDAMDAVWAVKARLEGNGTLTKKWRVEASQRLLDVVIRTKEAAGLQ